jgi:hypothetical protein
MIDDHIERTKNSFIVEKIVDKKKMVMKILTYESEDVRK